MEAEMGLREGFGWRRGGGCGFRKVVDVVWVKGEKGFRVFDVKESMVENGSERPLSLISEEEEEDDDASQCFTFSYYSGTKQFTF